MIRALLSLALMEQWNGKNNEKIMLVLDALGRAYIKNSKPEFDENSLMHHVHFVILNLPISNERLEQFKEKT